MTSPPPRILGAHLSVAGSLEKGVDRAVVIGANALQFFSGSPRGWARPPLNSVALQKFREYALEQGIRALFVHSLYLINLASDNTNLAQNSRNMLIHDLKLCEEIQGQGVVVHLGSHLGKGWEAVRGQVHTTLQEICDKAHVSAPLLVENSAGQQGKLCSELTEIRWLLDNVDRPQLGWCYDTCHGWAAGLCAEKRENGRMLLEELEKSQLWDSLKCIHVNDSRDPPGSGRDRHANLFEGTIPREEFVTLLNHPRLKHRPLITETPGLDGTGPDAENIQRIRSLLAE